MRFYFATTIVRNIEEMKFGGGKGFICVYVLSQGAGPVYLNIYLFSERRCGTGYGTLKCVLNKLVILRASVFDTCSCSFTVINYSFIVIWSFYFHVL